ncbi:peptidoglycan DD-metalloendopeptidase family protein [Candidatus Gracilibacteria bacterium]|nr:peptidoglycan DD-metalloendopeptidase family protein [Candidatus Gracilibacteria bacterium]
MYKRVIALILINTIFFSNNVFAETTKEQKKAILETFQSQEIKNIFDNTDFFDNSSDTSLMDSSNKVDIYSTLKSKAEEKRIYMEKQNEQLIERISSLENSIASVDRDIQDKITEVNHTNIRIIQMRNDIENGRKAIDLLKKKIKHNRQVLLEYVTHIYKEGNLTFDDSNNIDNIKGIILNGEDIGEILNDLHFKSMLELTGQKLIEKHRQYVGALYVKKMELEKNQKSLITLRNHLIIEKKVLDEKKEFKKRILDLTKGKEELYKKYIKDKLEIEKKMKLKEFKETLIFQNIKNKALKQNGCEYVDISKYPEKLTKMSSKCLELNKIIYGESKLQKLNYIGINPFKWPLSPAYGITAYYHDKEYLEAIGGDHNAIDIRAKQGSSVKAASDGYVVYLNPPTSDSYSYVAIKHSDGFVTVYGHLSEVLVRQYDYVKEGEVFAKSGGEYGTKGAGLLTTGPHLHFEVIQNREFSDPLEYLDTSYINFAELQEKYKYKFYNDFKVRKGYEYQDVTKSNRGLKVDGLTEVERQKSLLDRYAKGGFRDWNMWVEESLDGNIDPTFVMCIGIAETGLGKHTKTDNNVGNVGNTDSGATKTMGSPRDGVRSIVFTLNNKYLSKYTELKQLSRYGNKTGSIYASSEFNWHNNITKCMSVIKQQYIPEDFNFRIYN